MPDPADVEEFEYLDQMVKLGGWRVLRNLFSKHRIHCIENAHKHLKRLEDRKAGEWLARSEEPNILLSLVYNRRKELSDRINKERIEGE